VDGFRVNHHWAQTSIRDVHDVLLRCADQRRHDITTRRKSLHYIERFSAQMIESSRT
jgi:hypothetical protein